MFPTLIEGGLHSAERTQRAAALGAPPGLSEADAATSASSGVLSASLDAIKSSQARQRPTIMVISAEDGSAQVCVPACGELRVIEDRRLRMAVWPDGPIALALDRGAPVLLIVADTPDVRLIDATARRLDNAAMVWAHYDLAITSARVADRGTAPHDRSDPPAEDTGPLQDVLPGGLTRRRSTRSHPRQRLHRD